MIRYLFPTYILMEWNFVLNDDIKCIPTFITTWKSYLDEWSNNAVKVKINLDLRNAMNLTLRRLMMIVIFIGRNKNKITNTTEKISIIASSERQQKLIKSGIRLSPKTCPIEIFHSTEKNF